MSEGAAGLPTLRPYQLEAARAILESVVRGQGRSFSVEIARQGGKNELSARVELNLLLLYRHRDVTAVKAAPTLRPQALISLRRLWERLRDAGLGDVAVREGGTAVRLGRARQVFLSAEVGSNVVGHTADLLLEVDEAQDVDVEKFDKEFRPMAASTGATTVFYGTAWDDDNLLERAKQDHLALERRDGLRRHFEYDWRVVAACNPAYGRYVEGERQRLGEEHPLFLTQYCLRTLPGGGRLLGPGQLALLRGSHPRLEAPVPGESYVAGLDVGGEAAALGAAGEHDASVLTMARVRSAEDGPLAEPTVEVVRHDVWTGVAHAALYRSVLARLQEWRVSRVVVDATGIGEPLASFLGGALGPARVQALKLTAEAKSRLGYGLLAAVNAGRVRLYAPATGGEGAECWRQLERCRALYRPNQTLSFFVPESEGHDDYVVSLALAVAAAGAGGPRRARGRKAAAEDAWG